MTAPTPYSVLIVDDEQPARERLERLVADIDGWNVVGSCATGLEALDLVTAKGPAVVLMDIRMPGMTGLEAARHLSALDEPPAVVFTTAYDQYAAKTPHGSSITDLQEVQKTAFFDSSQSQRGLSKLSVAQQGI